MPVSPLWTDKSRRHVTEHASQPICAGIHEPIGRSLCVGEADYCGLGQSLYPSYRLSGRCWKSFNRTHGNRFMFHYTPIHAAVNQIEVFFSILCKRCLKNASFRSTKELRQRLPAFIQRWNKRERHPFTGLFAAIRCRLGRYPEHECSNIDCCRRQHQRRAGGTGYDYLHVGSMAGT